MHNQDIRIYYIQSDSSASQNPILNALIQQTYNISYSGQFLNWSIQPVIF